MAIVLAAFSGADALCPKCNVSGATVTYHTANLDEHEGATVEHVHRACLTCGYRWVEAPASTGAVGKKKL